MKPVLFNIGPLPISAFGLFLLLAFWLGISMARRRSGAVGIDSNTMLDVALYMIIAGIVGGRIGYVLVNLPAFAAQVSTDPLAPLKIWKDAGLTFYGALAGATAVAWLYARARRLSLARFLDAITPGLAAGYAVAMIGALLHGLFRGKPSGVPWHVRMLPDFELRHPTQIYLLIAALGIYVVVRRQREAAPGAVVLIFLFLHAVSRFVVEFFVESPLLLGPLTMAQVAAAVVGLLSLAGLLLVARRPVAGPAETAWAGSPPPVSPPAAPPPA
ncbi:MAG TPA: prolipoprotein diacylglyceryl transferase [bacterium]|jgi:phosphatidylglycerol:prolipoprotein diacylglycerol transferase|nr:prolipoprotein diacylglyceryl transferase [bacterium]